MEVKYISSNKKEYDLISDKVMVTSGNFHSYSWEPQKTEKKYGDRVYDFTKESKTYKMTITVRGTLEQRKILIDEMRDSFERDIFGKTPGTFVYGEWKIKAYLISSDTQVSDVLNCWTAMEVEIYCPYPFWIRTEEKHFFAHDADIQTDLEYPYDYPHDYYVSLTSDNITNESPEECDLKIVIFGRVINPLINIGDQTYEIETEVEDEEYLTINTETKKILLTKKDGSTENCFYARVPRVNFFRGLPTGKHLISWSGEFGFDITILHKRSEPRWS